MHYPTCQSLLEIYIRRLLLSSVLSQRKTLFFDKRYSRKNVSRTNIKIVIYNKLTVFVYLTTNYTSKDTLV